MRAFDEAALHEALDAQVAPAPVPPLPFQAIVRTGTRRRRARRLLSATGVAAAVAAVAVLAATTWSGPSAVGPSAPGGTPLRPAVSTPAASASLPVRTALPTGTVRGARWALQVVDYRSGGMYCQAWKVAVDDRSDPENNGGCKSRPRDQSDLTMQEIDIQTDPANHSSAELGVLFAGNTAPPRAVTLRATWAGGSATTRVFLMRGDVRHWFALALPYLPGHPASYYVTTLTFLDAAGHVVLDRITEQPPRPWTIDEGPQKP